MRKKDFVELVLQAVAGNEVAGIILAGTSRYRAALLLVMNGAIARWDSMPWCAQQMCLRSQLIGVVGAAMLAVGFREREEMSHR